MDRPNFKDVKGMLICGILSSENVDSSGEVVSLDGMDISSLEAGEGVANYEHLGAAEGQGKEVVGRIVYVKKIYKESDCDDEDEKFLFKETRKKPYLFGIIRLADGAGHHEAQDLAAHIRDHVAHNEDVLLRYSIEGSTVEKEGNYIKTSIARKVAMTFGPANKAVKNKIIADPNAPEGFEKFAIAKSEVMQDPTCRPIGSAVELHYNPLVGADRTSEDVEQRLLKNLTILKTLRKAMEAGCGEGAPSTLTQGAALQKEDLGNVVKNNVLGAIRDYGDEPWDRKKFKNHLKKYLSKAQLPEVSDSFIEHFVDVAEASKLKKSVDEWHLQTLQKKEGATPVLSSPHESVIEEDHSEIPEAVPTHLTFRGKKLKPNPKVKKIVMDTKKGFLHTPFGSFKLHNPATESPEIAQHFQDCMNSPHTHKIMSEAMKGWHQVHQLNKAGELPDEIPMTATILSTCSGNRPVPLTELQTVRIVDAMKNSGIDIRKPGFEAIMPHLRALDKPDVLPVTGGESIGKDPAYFLGGKIGVERDAAGNKLGEPSKSAGTSGAGPKVVTADSRYPGELKTINPLLSDTIKHLSQYHKVHQGLVDLVKRHKHSMASGIKELMSMKQARTNWNNTRANKVKKGLPDPGEYKGLNIPGIKLKTGLYAYGMMGGGDSVVPDTHFIRHMFGLDTHKDSKTLLYLKNALWNPSNYPLIEQYNDWYRKNHPAHKWMVNHPEFGKMFEKPEDATFPAFWANWMNIAPYEQKLGTSYGKQAHNMGSTHAPYWDAIAPHVNQAMTRLGKSEDFDTTFPLRAALIMQHYVRDYGEIPAQLLYYQHLVPKLLECAKNRQDATDATDFLKKALKLEEYLVELRKDIRHVVEGGHSVEMPEVYKVNMHEENGKSHPAGRFMTSKGQLKHLEDYHGLLRHMVPEGPVTAQTISRIHGLMASPHFDVQEHPMDTTHLEATDPVKAPTIPQVSIEKQPEPKKPGVFSYFRPGMSKPHVVEFTPQGAALDGKALTHGELSLMLENSRKGLAQIKWHTGEGLNKSELLWKGELEQFYPAHPTHFAEARSKAPAEHQPFLHPYNEQELSGMKTFLSSDKTAGYAVKSDGDIVNVFNHGKGGRGDAIMRHAISQGGNKLDCYDGFLPNHYKKFGFQEHNRIPFAKQYAPKGWDYNKFKTPDVVHMKLGQGLAKSIEALAKREATEDLMDLDEATRHIRAAEAAGHLPKGTAAAHTRHIYEDEMVPGIGNKRAAQLFRRNNKPGVYASLDCNDFKHINDTHGHDFGDEAIKSFGNALKNASAKVGTTKIFRPGGDEFVAWSPTHEDMSHFLRHAREHIQNLPPVAGVHKQSFSVGLGHNFSKADEALGIAKQGKFDPVTKQRLHAPGQTPNLGHSLYPGNEGPLMQPEVVPPKMAL